MKYPTPVVGARHFKRLNASSQYRKVFNAILNADEYCFEDTYGTAMSFYSWFKKQVNLLVPICDYSSSRDNRDKLKQLTSRLFVRIVDHNVHLQKSPHIPWLKEFYPELNDFFLPFTDVLGMNGSYQWFTAGVEFPSLGHKVHPYYGVYFPTRTEHLLLFDEWLNDNKGISNAIDMGTGCGVLTFYMLKHGVENVLATDINPNAIHSIALELKRLGLEPKVKPMQANLFSGVDVNNRDLVAINPPWIPAESFGNIDLAMYYTNDFFANFFSQAALKLSLNSRLVILFSTFAQAAGLNWDHPIRRELDTSSRFSLVDYKQVSLKQQLSSKKSWLSNVRSNEKVELWELKLGK